MDGVLQQALRQRILILDGAMGTMLQRRGLSGNNEAFNFSHPEVIRSIHRAYIDAGADIITSNSFNANRFSLADYGCADRAGDFAREAARLSRAEADAAPRKVWVAGSMGPTGKSLTLAQDLSDPLWRPCSFDEMADAYAEQIRGLVDGGVDLLLLETCFDALNAKAALYARSRIPEAAALPLIISLSVSDRSGRTLCGQTPEAFYRSVQHGEPLCFGLNCSLGADELAPLIADVASWADCGVSCYPNAGLPNEMGAYDESPEHTAAALHRMALDGHVNLVGGCCGTSPEHIRAIAEAVRGIAPRPLPEPDERLSVSGLESVTIDPARTRFVNIGERTNVAGSRRFAKLIAAGDYATALEVAAGQIEGGARIIDINLDDAMLDSAAEMERFLRHIAGEPAVAKAAVMIDSSHWETLLTGLKNAPGKCLVNSISLKEGEEVFLEHAREIRRLGGAVIVMAFDEEGQATTFERKIAVSERAYRLLTEHAGYSPRDIVLDVNVLSVGTGIAEHARYGIDFIEAVRWIKAHLPGALTSGGISNLSFAFRGNNPVREAMHAAFLYHAVAAGLDMGIVNPAQLRAYDDIDPDLLKAVEDVILDRDSSATERLSELAGRIQEDAAKSDTETPVAEDNTSPDERLVRALTAGSSATLEDDLRESLALHGRAVDVIEGPLMDGMAQVGERFGAGKMFLPQVVKSARLMRDAVAFLQPYMEAEGGSVSARKRILLATVKGDVHDIGKNITGIVLRCNGFEVNDLGVMVPAETILSEAERTGADLIGVSGLITPSLHQMELLCREMAERGMTTPLLVGGATTSALHTAVKLAPLYGHVYHAADASASAVLAGRLVSDREGTEAAEHRRQEEIRALYEARKAPEAAVTPSEAFPAESFLRGIVFAGLPAQELPVEALLPHFDWTLFLSLWGVKASDAAAADSLKNDARRALEAFSRPGGVRICVAARFDACHAEGDEIVAASWRLPMLREAGGKGRSLADFVPPAAYGFDAPAGLFAISVHRAHPAGRCDCGACGSDYEPMLERSIRLVLAEAASRWLQTELEAQLPQGSRAQVILPAIGYPACPDHSLKRDILPLLPDGQLLDIQLTESCAMIPDASICGLVFAHPDAAYPDIRRLSPAALDAYAALRRFSPADRARFLGQLVIP